MYIDFYHTLIEILQPSVHPRHSQFDKKRDRVVEFDEKRDRVLIVELKQLYTAITRARCNVWIFDESDVKRKPMFDYFKAHDLVVTEVERCKCINSKSIHIYSTVYFFVVRQFKYFYEINVEIDKNVKLFWSTI